MGTVTTITPVTNDLAGMINTLSTDVKPAPSVPVSVHSNGNGKTVRVNGKTKPAPDPERAALLARIAELEAQAAQAQRAQQLTLKISEKGAVSLYGLGRFPVTLYAEQWLRVCGHVEPIRQFIQEHTTKLSWKS